MQHSQSEDIQSRCEVLIFIDHYLPGFKAGGPTRTTANLIEWLGDDIQFRVVTKDRDLGEASPYQNIVEREWNTVGKAEVRYLSPSELSPRTILALVRQTPHNVIYLNSVFSTRTVTVLVLSRLGQIKIPIIIAARGNLSSGALGLKSLKKRAYLGLARLLGLYRQMFWHSTSGEETADIRRVFGTSAARIIRQISNLPVPINPELSSKVEKKPGQCNLVMVARITRMKNVAFAAHALRQVRGSVRLDLWGPIEDQAYWQECQQRFAELPEKVQVCHRGIVSPHQVQEVLSQYDALFMPSLSENFGHAIIEALSVGCPVLISDRTPWNDINERGAGWALPLDQTDRFRDVVQQLVDADDETMSAYRNRALAYAEAYRASSTAVEDMRQYFIDVAASRKL